MSYNQNTTSGNTGADWQYSGAQVDPRTNEQASDFNTTGRTGLNSSTQANPQGSAYGQQQTTSSFGQQQQPTSGYNTRSSGLHDATTTGARGTTGTTGTGAYDTNQTSTGAFGANDSSNIGSTKSYGSDQYGSQQNTTGHGLGTQEHSTYGTQDSSHLHSQGNPSMGDKVKGGLEKMAGKMKGDSRQVAEGEARSKGFNTNLQ